jgi:hypothetical protein
MAQGFGRISQSHPERFPISRRSSRVILLSSSKATIQISIYLRPHLRWPPSSLDIGFAKIKVNVGGVIRPACLYHAPSLYQSLSALYLANTGRDKLLLWVGDAEGSQINDVFRLMTEHDHGILELTGVGELLLDLKDLPHFSPLQILGYFAILESVLTHQPRPDDRYDSLTRQITNKLALLNRRWNPAFDYRPLGGASDEKIWPLMYAYRSAIAHGVKLDFAKKLALLKNAEVANALVIDAVKNHPSSIRRTPSSKRPSRRLGSPRYYSGHHISSANRLICTDRRARVPVSRR